MASDFALSITSTISPSKAEMFIQGCQQKWAYVYVEKIPRPPAAALKFGTAWDRFASDEDDGYWTQKKRDGKDLTEGQAAELFDSMWKEEQDHLEDVDDKEIEDLQKIGTAGAPLWRRHIGVTHEPVKLQQRFQYEVDGGAFALNGILDTTLRPVDEPPEEKPKIHDDKTSGQSWLYKTGDRAGKPMKKATASLQPAAYTQAAEALPERIGEVNTDKFVFDVLVKTKTPQLQRIEVDVTAKDRESHLILMANVRQQMIGAIDSGYFLPNRASNFCSRNWCPYADKCIAQHGGTVE